MKKNTFILFLLGISVLIVVAFNALMQLPVQSSFETLNVSPKNNTTQISANGAVHSQNEVTLHFQTSGKLTSLPVKEGDTVTKGQTIASLDTFALQKQLTTALNAYKAARDTYDQTQANYNTGVLQNSQKYTVELQNKGAISNEDSVINDMAQRILDQNQASLDTSTVNVELATNALSLATLTSPIDGVVTHEDVSVTNVNVSPTTSFSIADPSSIEFKAYVMPNDIDFLTPGAKATIHLDGSSTTYNGTVTKILPQKVTLPNGQTAYEVDITDVPLPQGKLGQNGTVLITANLDHQAILIPQWVVLGHAYVWTLNDKTPVLKKIVVGQTHGNMIEVMSGLSPMDKIITNPDAIAKLQYKML